jgi:isochorismate pyruvate lyase
MTQLDEYRANIDVIDAKIVQLIAQRKREVEKVIEVKRQHDIAPLQPKRFAELLTRVMAQAEREGLDPALVEAIWHSMHNYFVEIEKKELS